MQTFVSWPSRDASIWPTSKSENSCENTKRDQPLQGIKCAIVALMTFLVVAAFNPDRSLLNPSPKLVSYLCWFVGSSDIFPPTTPGVPGCRCFSSRSRFILFITPHPIRNCFLASCSCVDLLWLKWKSWDRAKVKTRVRFPQYGDGFESPLSHGYLPRVKATVLTAKNARDNIVTAKMRAINALGREVYRRPKKGYFC